MGKSEKQMDKEQGRNQRIIDTAFRLFVEKKIEAVSMDEVAKEAGVGRATLFRCYNNKTELAIAVCESKWKAYLDKLDEAGVDTADILHVEGPSGTTVITVSAEGENTIVYSPGSNAKASAGYVQSHRTTIAECAVLGLCLESPISTVIAAAQTAHDAGVTVLLNDSPFMDELPHELVEATDILLVNQHEVAQLLGLPDGDVESLDWYEVAERFTDYGFDRAIVTLGASGSVVIENGRGIAYPPRKSMQWTPPVAATRSWELCWLAWPLAIRCCNPRKSAPTSPPMRPPSLVPKVPTVPPKKSSPTSADL